MKFNNRYHQTFAGHYHSQLPAGLHDAELVCKNSALADYLGLGEAVLSETDFVKIFAGQAVIEGMEPLAQKYTGHQFGQYNPQLGDGRGLLLGEAVAADGKVWDLHLKGAGTTPYSRGGDGRAVLRSSIREFLISEALHHLNIPTSRALCVIAGSDPVYRETVERAAMTTRVCQSHLRFGHFEYLYHTQQFAALSQLIEFTIDQYYPHCRTVENPALALLEAITLKTAQMIAAWQANGFCHGVMNTDNMSILGLTFDFGPFAFLDTYQADYICNHSDHTGRYAFNKQPQIGLWNLNCLAYAFSHHLSVDQLKQALKQFEPEFTQQFHLKLQQKLGLSERQDSDLELFKGILHIMQKNSLDYTLTWRGIAQANGNQTQLSAVLGEDKLSLDWIAQYRQRIQQETLSEHARQQQMLAVNPKFVLRNYLLQQAIKQAEQGDYSEVQKLYALLQAPFDEQLDFEQYAQRPPEWAKSLSISCSS